MNQQHQSLLEWLQHEASSAARWSQHRIRTLIAGALVISFVLVVVALNLYNSSGAAQLDMSRPGYQDVRNLTNKSVDFDSFPSSGEMDQNAFAEFDREYNKRLKSVTDANAFSGDSLSDKALGLPAIANN